MAKSAISFLCLFGCVLIAYPSCNVSQAVLGGGVSSGMRNILYTISVRRPLFRRLIHTRCELNQTIDRSELRSWRYLAYLPTRAFSSCVLCITSEMRPVTVFI